MDDLSFLTGANVCCIMQTPANNYFWHTVGDKQPNMEEMIPIIIKSIDQKAGKESHFFQNKRNKKNFKWTKEMKSKLQTTGSLAADASSNPLAGMPLDMQQYQQYLSSYLAMNGLPSNAAYGAPWSGAAPMMYATPHGMMSAAGYGAAPSGTNMMNPNGTPGVAQQQYAALPPPSLQISSLSTQAHTTELQTPDPDSTCLINSLSSSCPPQISSSSTPPPHTHHEQAHAAHPHPHHHHHHHPRGTSSTQKMRICTNIVSKKTGKRVSFGGGSSAIDSKNYAHDTPFLSPPALSVTPSLSPGSGSLSAVRLATPPTALLMAPIDIATPKHFSNSAHQPGSTPSRSFLSPLSSSSKYPSPLMSPAARGLRHKHRGSGDSSSYSDIETPRFTKNMPWLTNTIASDSDFPLGDDIFASAANEHFSYLE